MKLTLLLPLLLPTTLAATQIPSALTSITTSTTTLRTALTSWNGHLLTTIPVLKTSAALLTTLKSATKTARASDPLSFDESIQVAQLTQNLAGVVNGTLETLIGLKTKFDRILLSPAILLNLELEKQATKEFSDVVVGKVPEALRETAAGLVKVIADSFDKAIDKYCLLK